MNMGGITSLRPFWDEGFFYYKKAAQMTRFEKIWEENNEKERI